MKTYPYKNLSFPIGDDEIAVFEVEYRSPGNTGKTTVNIPGDSDPVIVDEGSATLGKGKDLRNPVTVASSLVGNPVPEVDKIAVAYKINGKVLVDHTNLKSETDLANPLLIISFPAK